MQDLTQGGTLEFDFALDYAPKPGKTESLTVQASLDGGATWKPIWDVVGNYPPAIDYSHIFGHGTIDIPAEFMQPNVKLSFVFSSQTSYRQAAIDNVVLKVNTGASLLTIKAIEAPTPISVSFGTAPDTLQLPTEVNITLSDDSIRPVPVVWASSTYADGRVSGPHTFTGLLTLPIDVVDPTYMTMTTALTVTVEPETIVPETFPVQVTGGSGSGSYVVGTTVVIRADAPAHGYAFDYWYTADVPLADARRSETSFVMPARPVTIEARRAYIGDYIPPAPVIPTPPAPPSADKEIIQNPDGSTTEIVKKADGTTIEITKSPKKTTVVTSTPDGSVKVEEARSNGVRIISDTDAHGHVTARIQVPSVVGETDVTIPVKNARPEDVLVIVHPDGTEEVVRKTIMDNDGLRFTADENVTVKVASRSKQFTDIPASHWAAANVAYVTARGLYSGTSATAFTPDGEMTRGMLVQVLHNLENNPETAVEAGFHDVSEDLWCGEAIAWATEEGIVGGYPNGTFGANDSITREQLAVMLYRYAGSPKHSGAVLTFQDAASISSYALDAMTWAVENGILSGTSNHRLSPQDTATRAQVATMLMRLINK